MKWSITKALFQYQFATCYTIIFTALIGKITKSSLILLPVPLTLKRPSVSPITITYVVVSGPAY